MEKTFDCGKLNDALGLLNLQLVLAASPKIEIVVCGGSALIALALVPRTTQDVDIIALMRNGVPADSEPLPEYLVEAARKVGVMLNLPPDWLNNGPAAQFRMGLPEGFAERLHRVEIGPKLVVHYIDRLDQIFFKTFASADRGGYHVDDLKQLKPSASEIAAAARWCFTQDVSPGFREILKDMLVKLGWGDVGAEL